MEKTTLSLLMRDGAVNLTFDAVLTARQYARLIQIAEYATTKEELCNRAIAAAQEWEVAVEHDSYLPSIPEL